MHVLTIANQKGGTGKTSIALSFAELNAFKGKKTLCIDLDSQASMSAVLNADMKQKTSFDVLHGTKAAEAVQQIDNNLFIIPAAWELANETTTKGSATRLTEAITPLKKEFDLIVIDTPPAVGELQFNALMASTDLIIPLEAELFSVQALYLMADTAQRIQQANKHLTITGAIVNKFDKRSTLVKSMYDNINTACHRLNVPLLGVIRSGIAIKEAEALQTNLFEYAPKSNPAQDIEALYGQIFR